MMNRLKGQWVEHPFVDLIPSLALLAILSQVEGDLIPEAGLEAFIAALSTTAGLVMAAASFVCTILYQSNSKLVKRVFLKHGHTVARSWIFIITTTLIACVTASALTGFTSTPYWPARIGIALLVLVFLEGIRTIWWLNAVFTLNHTQVQKDDKARPANPEFLLKPDTPPQDN